VLEHADVMIAKIGSGVDDGAARDCASRASTVWASLIRSRGDATSAREATTKAMTFATSAEDVTSARAMEALTMSRECAKGKPWEVIERALGDEAKALSDASRAAALAGARALAALTRFRVDDAFASAERCAESVIDRAALEEAKSAPHGWAVATALKTLGHVERLRAADDDAYARALEYYTRALEYATDVSINESPGAMASKVIAEEIIVDCRLALAQLLISAEDVTLAETHAARAVSGAEALGDDKHPCVGVAVAVSGDVYVAKALRSTSGASALGDGAGVMFAEGLYRNAIKLMHYPHMVEDAEIVLDYEARHLCALLHARYSSVLRASGEQRRSESDAWLASAKLLWPDERERDEGGVNGLDVVTSAATKLGTKNGIEVLIDLQQMTPLTVGR
jgi:tetratricopeptide (TPR) repeat protein